ncbi:MULTISPECIES: DUF1614 domain-containing protein [Carboxydothermus]|uniref:Membrane protein n=2 Tax=Carboxydothermus TaxID=129957 RepID=A0ABX2RBR6_9THEO|nr:MULTISPECIES: DUF1614 domain-containing protein [Carboxydothermus]ABB14545.1 putative membrane protein [Carboxydothermus hydrogenoformans Z-2901]NYE58638.1 putative membrane protein [Carboxydothermus ferrireducens DSM 11255]
MFSLGTILLVILVALIFFGLMHRVLDRMKLTDREALVLIGLMIVGSFLDLTLLRGRITFSLNLGGGIVPLVIAGYLLYKAGSTKEWVRALIGSVVAAVAVYFVTAVLMRGNVEPAGRFEIIDPLYVAPIVAAVVGYIAGRSRRGAFIAATVGLILNDLFHLFYLITTNTPGRVDLGGGGVFDGIVVAGILAVILAEVVGETRERLQGGPATEKRDQKLLEGLKNPEPELTSSLGITGEAKENENKNN